MSTILILGATSSIAEQFARLYAREESHLILVARDENKLKEVAKNLKVLGAGQVSSIQHNFSEMLLMESLVDEVVHLTPSIDVMLVAFGTLPDQAECESNAEYCKNEFLINGLSPVLVISAFYARYKDPQISTIAAISSVAGDRGRQSNYLYGSAKSALSTFLSGLRNRCATQHTHVLTIKPGFVDTPMTKNFKKGLLWVGPEKVAADIKHAIEKRKDVIYTPWYWYWIMLVIKLIPEFLFKKLKL